jgi:hypothetical protein
MWRAKKVNGVLLGGLPWWIDARTPPLDHRRPELDVTRDQAVAASNGIVPNRVPHDAVQELVLDYDCDGGNDYVLGWLDADHPEGPHYEITIAYRQPHPLGEHSAIQVHWQRIPFEPYKPFHLCVADGQPDKITLKSVLVTPELREQYGIGVDGGRCPNAIVVQDRTCPAILFSWSQKYRFSVFNTLE